jgi:hypothetical protein
LAGTFDEWRERRFVVIRSDSNLERELEQVFNLGKGRQCVSEEEPEFAPASAGRSFHDVRRS